MSRPLGSTPITGASSLLRDGPPATAATVLNSSRFLPPGALPLAPPNQHGEPCPRSPSHVPCESRRRGSRRLCAGHRLANRWAPARLLPDPSNNLVLMSLLYSRHVNSGRLPRPHLTHHVRLFHIA